MGHEGFYAGWDASGTTETSSATTIVVLLRDTSPGIVRSVTLGFARVLTEQGVLRCWSRRNASNPNLAAGSLAANPCSLIVVSALNLPTVSLITRGSLM